MYIESRQTYREERSERDAESEGLRERWRKNGNLPNL